MNYKEIKDKLISNKALNILLEVNSTNEFTEIVYNAIFSNVDVAYMLHEDDKIPEFVESTINQVVESTDNENIKELLRQICDKADRSLITLKLKNRQ